MHGSENVVEDGEVAISKPLYHVGQGEGEQEEEEVKELGEVQHCRVSRFVTYDNPFIEDYECYENYNNANVRPQ